MIRQTLSFFPSIHQGIPNLRPLSLHFAMGWVLDVASIYTVLRVWCSLRCQFKYLPWSKLLAQPPPYFIHVTHFPLFALAVTYWWPVLHWCGMQCILLGSILHVPSGEFRIWACCLSSFAAEFVQYDRVWLCRQTRHGWFIQRMDIFFVHICELFFFIIIEMTLITTMSVMMIH